jgi:hypothetical protein
MHVFRDRCSRHFNGALERYQIFRIQKIRKPFGSKIKIKLEFRVSTYENLLDPRSKGTKSVWRGNETKQTAPKTKYDQKAKGTINEVNDGGGREALSLSSPTELIAIVVPELPTPTAKQTTL